MLCLICQQCIVCRFEYLGASSVGCLLLTVLTSFAWEKGFPPRMSKGTHAACLQPDVLQLVMGLYGWEQSLRINWAVRSRVQAFVPALYQLKNSAALRSCFI